jgi:hypothetical protein
MIAHGARMLMGALVLFFPYTFRDGDLSRYRYARHRWVVEGASRLRSGPLKGTAGHAHAVLCQLCDAGMSDSPCLQ